MRKAYIATVIGIIASFLLITTVAKAQVVSQLSSPGRGACIGRDHMALGAAWTDNSQVQQFGWELQYRPAGGPSWTTLKTGTNQITGSNGRAPITSFSTMNLESPLDLRLVVTADGVQAVSINDNVVLDHSVPGPPTNFVARAVASQQALFTWDVGGPGPGCSLQYGQTLLTTVHYNVPGVTDPGAVQTTAHAAIRYLGGGGPTNYTAYAENTVGNKSVESNVATVTARSDFKTVLAGKVSAGFGVNVTARNTSGQIVGQTMTDAGGWYNLALNGGSYMVQYGPACSFSFCAQGYQTTTDAISTIQAGDVQIHNK